MRFMAAAADQRVLLPSSKVVNVHQWATAYVNRLPLNIKAILGKYKAFFLNVKSMEPVKTGRPSRAYITYLCLCSLYPSMAFALQWASILYFWCLKVATCEMTPNQQAFRTALRIYFHLTISLWITLLVYKSLALNPLLMESFNQRGFALACLIWRAGREYFRADYA